MKIRVWQSKSYGYTEGCSDLQRSGRAGSETLCVCAVGRIYNTRLSVTTASVLLLWCTSLEEVLFIKDFKTSSPCCAFPSCLCSQELLKLVSSRFVTFQVQIPPHLTSPSFFWPNRTEMIVVTNHYLLTFILFVGCFHFPLENGLQAPFISVESLSVPTLLPVFQNQKSSSVAFLKRKSQILSTLLSFMSVLCNQY